MIESLLPPKKHHTVSVTMAPPASSSSPSNHNSHQRQQQQRQHDTLRKIAAGLGATGVALGAMGAHALKSTLETRKTLPMWQTASIYQLFHAAALMGLAGMCRPPHQQHELIQSSKKDDDDNYISKGGGGADDGSKKHNNNDKIFLAGKLLSVGTVLFSGSIYCLALNVGPKGILGPTTPIGGLIMISGWVVVGLY
jgi:uncharacterized membrane protein YgdD (TMEM256/DUF423 family)